jgi:hypothetical protein
MKKFFMLSALAAFAMGFAACSSEDSPIESQSNTQGEGTGAYVQMTFRMPSTTDYSRANDAESSEVYSIGTEAEYHINKVYLYFFNTADQLVTISGQNYLEVGVNLINKSVTTAEQNTTTAANMGKVYSTVTYQIPGDLSTDTEYHVYALCNRPYDGTISSPADLLNSTLTFSKTDISTSNGNLPMAARSYNGEVYEILKATKANNQANPYELDFEIERSYARIAFVDETFTFPLYTTNTEGDNKKELGTATVLKYQLVNTSNEFFTYRHVGTISDTDFTATYPAYTDKDAEGNPAAFGKITSTYPYVIDPHSGAKTNAYSKAAVKDFMSNLLEEAAASNFTQLDAATTDGPKSIEYVAENTMNVKAQKKGHTTGILFEVQLNPTAWADGTAIDTRNGNPDMYYYNGGFYKDIESLQKAGLADVTTANFTTYGVRYFKGGIGYYEYYIRHLNNNDNTDMGVMEFAIVRNNSYELSIKGLAMSPFSKLPGDPDPVDPDPKDPDQPTPGEDDEGAKVYMQVDVVVRPWIVRQNDMYLGH